MDAHHFQSDGHFRGGAHFASTHWSMVLAAGERATPDAERALAVLCQRYWFPLYAFARRRAATIHEAQDLTQAFFLRLLEKNVLSAASPDRGRFRSFLLTSMKHFLANEWDRATSRKQGGGRKQLSLDWESGESQLSLEPVHTETPEREFERRWALTLLENVVHSLRNEFAIAGKAAHFEVLKATLTAGRGALDYPAVAEKLSISEEAARKAAQRIRNRYRELLHEEVAATVESETGIEDEIHRLFQALGG